jgi:hypothetical protein
VSLRAENVDGKEKNFYSFIQQKCVVIIRLTIDFWSKSGAFVDFGFGKAGLSLSKVRR